MSGRPSTPPRSAAGIAAVGMIYQQGISFLSGLLIARVIGASEYGIFNVARNLLNLAVVFTKLGLDVGLQRYLGAAVEPRQLRARIRNLSALRWIAASIAIAIFLVLVAGGAALLQEHVFRFHDFAGVLIIGAVALPFLTDLGVLGGAYRGLLKPVPSVIADYMIQPTLRIVMVAILFFLGYRLWGVVYATTLAAVLSSLYLMRRARREVATAGLADSDESKAEVSEAPSREPLKPVLKFSVVLAVTMAVTLLTRSMDALFLGHFSNAQAVGQYTLAQTMMVLASIFGPAIGQTVGSQIARHYASNDLQSMQRVMRRQARLTAIVTAPICAWLAGWGSEVITIFGPTYHLPIAVMAVLSASQLANAVLSPSGYALSMTGRHRLELYIQCTGMVLTAVLCVTLVSRFDQLGAAVAAGCGALVSNVIRIVYVHRLFRVYALDTSLLNVVGLTLVVLAVVKLAEVLLSSTHGPVAVILGSVIYCLVISGLSWSLLLRQGERDALVSRLAPVLHRLGFSR